jgi:alanine racemase
VTCSLTPLSSHQPAIKLCIDKKALSHNYINIKKLSHPAKVAGVLKANAYGMGAKEVAEILWHEGCRHFFVAHNEEGYNIRHVLGSDAFIYVLNPLLQGHCDLFDTSALIPILNSFEQIDLWYSYLFKLKKALPAGLHVDTGMNRTGISYDEAERCMSIFNNKSLMDLRLIISHMSHRNFDTPYSQLQMDRFETATKFFPTIPKSLGSTSSLAAQKNIFFDMVRVGFGLYGFGLDKLKNVCSLWAQIYQVHQVKKGDYIGYEHTYKAPSLMKIATLLIGYGDGIPLSLSNKGYVDICGYRAPIVGRVSMDLMSVDVTHVPEPLTHPRQWVEIFGTRISPKTVADEASTHVYELFTRLGPRIKREWG